MKFMLHSLLPVFISARFVRSARNMPDESFPKTLSEFGYAFNEGHFISHAKVVSIIWLAFVIFTAGQLRIIDPATGKPGDRPFEFEVMKDNQHYNQRRYEALGEVLHWSNNNFP